MFERFSAGYYLGRLYVEPREGEPAMCRAQHEQVNEQLYADGEGIERLDRPLVMKVDERHLAVTGDETVPENTLAVPPAVLSETRVRNPPTLTEVLLAKADRAAQLLELTGLDVTVGSDETATDGPDDAGSGTDGGDAGPDDGPGPDHGDTFGFGGPAF
ncbi:MAG: DUF5802 family protein [Haloglomus sp.]